MAYDFKNTTTVSDYCYEGCGHSFAEYFDHHLQSDFYKKYVRSLIDKQNYCVICGHETTKSDRKNMRLYVDHQIRIKKMAIKQKVRV